VDWRGGEAPSRAVRDYLDGLEQINAVSDDEQGPQSAPPKKVSLTDPAARWTAAPGGPAFYACSTNYLIDLEADVIVDVAATPAHRTQEVESTRTMIDRVQERFGLKPKRLVGDTAYGVAPMLGCMVNDKGIAPHVPVWDRSERTDGTLSSSQFEWDEIARSVHESSRDVARALAGTPEYRQSRREHKKVETLFALLKRILKLDRLRLRGMTGASDEFLLAATAQNLRRMAKRLIAAGGEQAMSGS